MLADQKRHFSHYQPWIAEEYVLIVLFLQETPAPTEDPVVITEAAKVNIEEKSEANPSPTTYDYTYGVHEDYYSPQPDEDTNYTELDEREEGTNVDEGSIDRTVEVITSTVTAFNNVSVCVATVRLISSTYLATAQLDSPFGRIQNIIITYITQQGRETENHGQNH